MNAGTRGGAGAGAPSIPRADPNVWTCCCSVRLGCGVVCGGDCAVAGGEADDTGSLTTMLPCRFTRTVAGDANGPSML